MLLKIGNLLFEDLDLRVVYTASHPGLIFKGLLVLQIKTVEVVS